MAVSSGEGKTAGQHDPAQRLSARERAGEQGLLFDDRPASLPADVGYRGPTACSAAGITYRQLDYWARTDLVRPSIADGQLSPIGLSMAALTTRTAPHPPRLSTV